MPRFEDVTVTTTAKDDPERELKDTFQCELFTSVDEAKEKLSESGVLDIINAQYKTNQMNSHRAALREGPSRSQLRNKAQAAITLEEFQQIVSIADETLRAKALNDLTIKKMNELEATQKAA